MSGKGYEMMTLIFREFKSVHILSKIYAKQYIRQKNHLLEMSENAWCACTLAQVLHRKRINKPAQFKLAQWVLNFIEHEDIMTPMSTSIMMFVPLWYYDHYDQWLLKSWQTPAL